MTQQPQTRRVPADDTVFITFDIVMDSDQIEHDASALRQGECETVSNLFDKLRDLESMAWFSPEEREAMSKDAVIDAFEPFLLLTTSGRLARHREIEALDRLAMRLLVTLPSVHITRVCRTTDGTLRCKLALERERVGDLCAWLEETGAICLGPDDDYAVELSRYFKARGWAVEPHPGFSAVPLIDIHLGTAVLTRPSA